jgi:hypothetical protein
MFFQPAILALLLAAFLPLLALLLTTPFAIDIVRHWNLEDSSPAQLQRERRTYLFATLLTLVFGLLIAALLLFVFNADRMAEQFVGAMCAVGTLQADPWGFPALLLQIALFFLAAQWLLLNRLDQQARDYPLVKLKYWLLLGLLPLLALNGYWQWLYFAGLRADVITSCCGSLFSAENPQLSADLAGLPVRPGLGVFYGGLGLAFLGNLHYWWRQRWAGLAGLGSVAGFLSALTGILSFLSLYIYEHPHHHCPFCLLKPEYHYQGYALYVPLFIAAASGLGVAIIDACRSKASLALLAPAFATRLAWIALLCWGIFIGLSTGIIWQSRLMLLE